MRTLKPRTFSYGPKANPTRVQINRRLTQRHKTPEGFDWWVPLAYELWHANCWTYEEIGEYFKKPKGTIGSYVWAYKKHLVAIGEIGTTKRLKAA